MLYVSLCTRPYSSVQKRVETLFVEDSSEEQNRSDVETGQRPVPLLRVGGMCNCPTTVALSEVYSTRRPAVMRLSPVFVPMRVPI
jgi:hypothetical protein